MNREAKRETALEFSGVCFTHGGSAPRFADCSFQVPRGSITAVLGPNGAGKTTLLHLALGWLEPAGGAITLFGTNLRDYSPRQRGRAQSLLPQKEPTGFEFSVLEYVLLGRAPHLKPLAAPGPQDLSVATNALDRSTILALESRSIARLSGGETQLLLLARSLTQEPQLLLLDEPMNHLDLRHRKGMLELLRSWRSEGKTAVLTTHDPQTAALLADTLILVHPGGGVASGAFGDLFTDRTLSELYGLAIRTFENDGRYFIEY
jgi:iron complex transport system ATP-binding protein